MNAILGRQGEELAGEYLQRLGYRILCRNYRIAHGEIDLIAEHLGVLVFIEVKTRSGELFGNPFDAITRKKQIQLSKVALDYILRHNMMNAAARFDAVAVYMRHDRPARIEIVKNAFDLCYGI